MPGNFRLISLWKIHAGAASPVTSFPRSRKCRDSSDSSSQIPAWRLKNDFPQAANRNPHWELRENDKTCAKFSQDVKSSCRRRQRAWLRCHYFFLLTGFICWGTPIAVLSSVNGVKFWLLTVEDDQECVCGGMSMRIVGRPYSVFAACVMACGHPGLSTGGYREVNEVKEGEFGEWGSGLFGEWRCWPE